MRIQVLVLEVLVLRITRSSLDEQLLNILETINWLFKQTESFDASFVTKSNLNFV